MLAQDMRFLGQRQMTLLLVAQHVTLAFSNPSLGFNPSLESHVCIISPCTPKS